MHRRLTSYFDRKNCASPQDLADETLIRVARRLQEEGEITGQTPAHYCYTVARFVFLEHYRKAGSSVTVAADEVPASAGSNSTNDDAGMLRCLEECLNRLESDQRKMILEYYQGERRVKIALRRKLADRLGLTMNALTIRACRIRDRLEACVRACSGTSGGEVLSRISHYPNR
jgi:DNA-directed RNA polymerase specialized sigma24 family protein